jgi:hypothetical protein
MKIAEHLRHAEVTAVGDESLIALPQRVLASGTGAPPRKSSVPVR